jgi:hypothetical protein
MGPYGIPDFVAVTGSSSPRRQRLRLSVPPVVNETDAAIVAAAHPPHGATVAQIAARLSWQATTIERRLPDLVRSGALRLVSPRRFARPMALVPVGQVFAVELKVSDWSRALSQCRTYRTWANSYLLVMGKMSAESAHRLRREVAADGGGLIIDDEVILRARPRKLSPSRLLWTSEHVILACRRSH